MTVSTAPEDWAPPGSPCELPSKIRTVFLGSSTLRVVPYARLFLPRWGFGSRVRSAGGSPGVPLSRTCSPTRFVQLRPELGHLTGFWGRGMR